MQQAKFEAKGQWDRINEARRPDELSWFQSEAALSMRLIRAAGYEVCNEVQLNQVVVRFGDDATTERVIRGVQEEGTCWCGPTRWQGRAGMRISVSGWSTSREDVERSLEAILRVAARARDGA